MTKHKFTTPVSMKVTEKQYNDDLRGPLLELGYDEISIDGWKNYEYLVNNSDNNLGQLTNFTQSLSTNNGRYFIDHYNPELFLALAAITEGCDPIIGEYFTCIGNASDILDQNINVGDVIKVLKYECSAYKQNIPRRNQFGPSYDRGLFRKATKQELINHFTKSKNNNTNMSNNKKIFPLQLSPQNAQRIIDIACTTWTSKLAKRWGADIVQNNTIDIHQYDYENMRSACTSEQNKLFDEIFGSDKKGFELGDRVKVIDGGDGCYCANGITGYLVSKPCESHSRYSGELRSIIAEYYVFSTDTRHFYGLCEGCVIEFLD